MAAGLPRSGLFEVYIRQQWCRVYVTLNEDSLTLTLDENPELANSTLGSSDASSTLPKTDQLPDSLAGQKRLVRVVKEEQNGLGIMKYIREVSPYFRKTSALNDLGWGGQEAQRDAARANWNESKTIPLKLCYLCRNLSMSDPERKTLELNSPDGKSSCILRFPDPGTASEWFNLIHANVAILMRQCIEEANHIMSSAPNSGEIKHIGWLSEQLSNEQGTPTWKPVFLAVTDKDLMMYDTAPWSKEEWATPFQSHPLLATRLIHSGQRTNPMTGGDLVTFGTRCGTRNGVEMHVFRVETQRDLAYWSRALVQGSHGAAVLIKEVSCVCTWQNQEARLNLHYESGFTLYHANDDKIFWSFPYEKLRMSGDDGNRLMWLDFGTDGEHELDLQTCPKPIVFVLHTFLSAKVNRLGLVA
ncbi:Alpha-1-syntrophin,Beta-1-syntrophin,Beta-2-syntrophin [Mytilus coruscus]|uniref:Alpha-1-syntrophin,Beta-1-syntrophin,Beta-2-syntr ophin n=1 Tax=Mytilus coruscus TaxID=42192 RepID=A0A6J7ZZG7_MYTCO|nr:Alpha-1-syntrophin,Beta-1-syntrophin,Beta-2-syntrophin [Mytilus coruscus]